MPRKPAYTPYHLVGFEDLLVRGGRKGGRRTFNKYGVEHMRKIGRRGGKVYAARYVASGMAGLAAMNGDPAAIEYVKRWHTPPPEDDPDDPDENDETDDDARGRAENRL